MKNIFTYDYYRMTGEKWTVKGFLSMAFRYDLRYLYMIRRNKTKIRTLFAIRASRKYGLEILSDNIGPGLYIGHAHNINVNPKVVIGKNCNLNKGCTIGVENRGKRKGTPVLGDDVWIDTNAVVVGNITIGSDVLIAPNAYVNFDVPSHSIVLGNPGKIIKKNNATEGYIMNKI